MSFHCIETDNDIAKPHQRCGWLSFSDLECVYLILIVFLMSLCMDKLTQATWGEIWLFCDFFIFWLFSQIWCENPPIQEMLGLFSYRTIYGSHQFAAWLFLTKCYFGWGKNLWGYFELLLNLVAIVDTKKFGIRSSFRIWDHGFELLRISLFDWYIFSER